MNSAVLLTTASDQLYSSYIQALPDNFKFIDILKLKIIRINS